MKEITFYERSLVGLVLIDPSTLDRTEIELAGYVWVDPICSQLWPILCEMRRRGDPVGDPRLVGQFAGDRCGLVEIIKLAREAGMVGQDAYHLSKLVEAMDRSRLRRLANEIYRRADSTEDKSDSIREWASQQLHATPSARVTASSVGELMRQVIDTSRNPKPTTTIATGLYDLDVTIGGFRPGQLCILAARPSIGKSALASQIAIDAAKDNHAVLFVSLEMTATETVSRALAMETGIEFKTILDGQLKQYEIRQADEVAGNYQNVPLRVSDRRGLNIDRLSLLIRSEAAATKLGLVVVDYLGLVQGEKRKPRWEQITEISNALKTLAQSESIPILALCQLNRESEGETPKLSHLRDSGSIEQDADVVLLLHREKRSSKLAELFVAKNRNGPIAKLKLEYEASRFRFKTFVGGSDDAEPEHNADFAGYR